MNTNMSIYQTIFTFFYALYFAVFTTTTGKLHPFDTASMWNREKQAWIRFFLSLVMLNIIPFLYFYFVFNQLGNPKVFLGDFGSQLLSFLLSLAGMGFYRIFYGLMLIKRGNQYIFYNPQQYKDSNGIPKSLDEDVSKRPCLHKSVWPHLGPGLIWIAVSVVAAVL